MMAFRKRLGGTLYIYDDHNEEFHYDPRHDMLFNVENNREDEKEPERH